MNYLRSLVCSALLVLTTSAVSAQVATGTPPFGSFTGAQVDTVDLANLNVHFSIPVFSRAGRGLPFFYSMQYDSSIWQTVLNPVTLTYSWVPVDSTNTTWGWRAMTDAQSGYVTYSASSDCTGWIFESFVYHDSYGTTHPFLPGTAMFSPGTCSGPPTYPTSGTYVAADGSGYTLYAQSTVKSSSGVTTAIIHTRSGVTITPAILNPASNGTFTVTDTNGNQLTSTFSGSTTTLTDTLGTTALTIQGNPPTSYTYTAPNGANAPPVSLTYTAYSIQTNFHCPNIGEYSGSASLITKVALPDGSYYSVSYENTPEIAGKTTGRIASITLPTGGSITYTYTDPAGGGCSLTDGTKTGIRNDGSTAGLTRAIYDGTNTRTWSYTRSGTSGSVNTVTDPDSNQTVYTFSGLDEGERQIYQYNSSTHSQQLLETIITCYNKPASYTPTSADFSTCPTASVNSPITNKLIYAIFPNGGTQLYMWVATNAYINTYGLPTEVDNYDWTTATASLKRKDIIAYASFTNTYIQDRPSSITIQDGAGNQAALTNFPGYDSNGNLTSQQNWVGGTTYLTKGWSYNSNGTLNTVTDVNQTVVATYSYAGASCNNTFPTSVTGPSINGIALSTAYTWNCYAAVPSQTTDADGQSTTINSYDVFSRPTQVTDALGNIVNGGFSQTSGEANMEFNSNSSLTDGIYTTDGLGRVHVTSHRQGPNSPLANNYEATETDYDPEGRPNRITMPYLTTSGYGTSSSAPAVTTIYDPLGRPTNVTDAGGGVIAYSYNLNDVLVTVAPPSGEGAKQRQYEYDGLGRLTSVCEITTANGSSTCGQSNSKTGFWTRYQYNALGKLTGVCQNTTVPVGTDCVASPSSGQQTRTFGYDAVGRITQETNPENGITQYFWDFDASCSRFNGDLSKKTDAAGNSTCYAYDAIHRLTLTNTFTGPNSANTPLKYFVYDSATVNSDGTPYAMANAKGRLAEAYTCASYPCTSKITDEALSYSARGEVADFYELTPHSGNPGPSGHYYHLTQSYWSHGLPKSLSSNVTGLPTINYGGTGTGLDGEGRVTQVTGGPTLLQGATYVASGTTQPIGAITQITLGSNDTDNFTYDPNTGRMTEYKFLINGLADTGDLTWNANGSLRQLTITDALPPPSATDSQTCTYTHDDLGRIASVNCPQGNWLQTFSYDAFGNISKSGSVSFMGPYSNNRIMPFQYDSDGNLISWPGHAATWDAEDQAHCLDSIVLVRDVFERIVEEQSGGTCSAPGTTYQQIVYSTDGSKLLTNGRSLIKAYVPLPGGATAVFNSSGVLAYYRHSDWLGSSRLASTPARTLYYSGAYGPFGESYTEFVSSGGQTDHSFTGENEDTKSRFDDFRFREYAVADQGRWISPDPAGLTAVSLTNPQTLNRYAYVGNNPLNRIDPLGLDPCDAISYFITNASCGGVGPGGQMIGGGGGGAGGGNIGVSTTAQQFFGSNYYNLPGNENVIAQDQNGWYASEVSEAFHPEGPGWAPVGRGNPDLQIPGCWSNSLNDLNWCPNAGTFMSNVIVVWNGRAPFMPHVYAIGRGSTATMRAPSPPVRQPTAAAPDSWQALFCLSGGDPELAGTTTGPGTSDSPWDNGDNVYQNGTVINPGGASAGSAAAGAAGGLGAAADCLGRSPF